MEGDLGVEYCALVIHGAWDLRCADGCQECGMQKGVVVVDIFVYGILFHSDMCKIMVIECVSSLIKKYALFFEYNR